VAAVDDHVMTVVRPFDHQSGNTPIELEGNRHLG
jgi:hypothetical protein